MLGALLVVIIVAALCCIAKCNFSFLRRQRKRKMRASERRRNARAQAAQSTVSVTAEKKSVGESPPANNKTAEKKVMAISKSNPQHRQEDTKQKSKKDLIIDIIDSALEGDICEGDMSRYSSSESIDRFDEERVLRRASCNSVTLSLVFDTETDRPVFRRL